MGAMCGSAHIQTAFKFLSQASRPGALPPEKDVSSTVEEEAA
jgi:hypothetical protein